MYPLGCFQLPHPTADLGFCRDYLHYPSVFLNDTRIAPGATLPAEFIRAVEAVESTAVHNEQFRDRLSFFAPGCHRAYVKYMCQQYIPGCYVDAGKQLSSLAIKSNIV